MTTARNWASLRSLSAVALLVAISASCDRRGRLPTTPSDARADTLAVSISQGVTGSPQAGTTEYRTRTRIPYAFSSAEGYERLRVLIDAVESPATGSILMDTSHTLVALADAVIRVPVAIQQQFAGVTQAMTSLVSPAVRPMDAYRQFSARVDALALAAPEDSLMVLLTRARLQAFSLTDATKLSLALREISDSLAVSYAPAGLSTVSTGTSASTPEPAEITYIYVNGIRTSWLDWRLTATRFLPRTIREAGFSDSTRFRVDAFYNPTGRELDIRDVAAAQCLEFLADGALEGRAPSADTGCEPVVTLAAGVIDFGEAILQVLSRVHSRGASSSPTAVELADMIRGVSDRSRVVVVAHSQGNLYLDAAYRILQFAGGVNPRCVGTVSLAPPLPVSAISGGPVPAASFVAGESTQDILLQLAAKVPGLLPRIPGERNSNILSSSYDSWYDYYHSFWLRIQPGDLARRSWHWYVAGIGLHSVDRDYLLANRAVSANMIRAQSDSVLRRCAGGLAFSALPTVGTVGTALGEVEVAVQGPNGALAGSAEVPVTIRLGDGAAAPTMTVMSSAGVARFTGLTPTMAGTFAMIATTPGAQPVRGAPLEIASASAPFEVTRNAGLAASMTITNRSLYGFGNSQCFNVCVAAGINRVDLETGTVRSIVAGVQNNSGIINPVRLLSDGAFVYWLDGNVGSSGARIRRVSVEGGTVDSLAGGFGVPGSGALYADSTHLYFASTEAQNPASWTIKRVPKGGGQVESIVTASPYTGFAVDSGYLYYQLRLSGQIRRMPVGGGPSTVVAANVFLSENRSTELYVGGGTLYYSDLESIRTVPKSGGTLLVRAAEPGATNMISDGSALYIRSTTSGEIVRFSLLDYSRSVVTASAAEGPALDDNYVYWSTFDTVYISNFIGSRILRIPK